MTVQVLKGKVYTTNKAKMIFDNTKYDEDMDRTYGQKLYKTLNGQFFLENYGIYAPPRYFKDMGEEKNEIILLDVDEGQPKNQQLKDWLKEVYEDHPELKKTALLQEVRAEVRPEDLTKPNYQYPKGLELSEIENEWIVRINLSPNSVDQVGFFKYNGKMWVDYPTFSEEERFIVDHLPDSVLNKRKSRNLYFLTVKNLMSKDLPQELYGDFTPFLIHRGHIYWDLEEYFQHEFIDRTRWDLIYNSLIEDIGFEDFVKYFKWMNDLDFD